MLALIVLIDSMIIKFCLLGIGILGYFSCFLSSADFFQNQLFRKVLSGTPFEYQTDWIQIRPDILLGLILVQSACKGHQQMTLEGRVKCNCINGAMTLVLLNIFMFYSPLHFVKLPCSMTVVSMYFQSV